MNEPLGQLTIVPFEIDSFKSTNWRFCCLFSLFCWIIRGACSNCTGRVAPFDVVVKLLSVVTLGSAVVAVVDLALADVDAAVDVVAKLLSVVTFGTVVVAVVELALAKVDTAVDLLLFVD